MNRIRIYACCATLAAGSIAALAAAKGDAAKGKEIVSGQCAVCHNTDSTDKKMGPGLKGLFKKGKLESNGKPATETNILGKIEEGGNGMPAFKDMLSDQEKADLMAYLKTL